MSEIGSGPRQPRAADLAAKSLGVTKPPDRIGDSGRPSGIFRPAIDTDLDSASLSLSDDKSKSVSGLSDAVAANLSSSISLSKVSGENVGASQTSVRDLERAEKLAEKLKVQVATSPREAINAQGPDNPQRVADLLA